MIIALPDWGWKNICQRRDSPQKQKLCLLKVFILVLILSVVKTEHADQGFSFAGEDCPQNDEVLAVHTDFTSQIVKNGRKLLLN